jgi:autoinducer 2-degrading protein
MFVAIVRFVAKAGSEDRFVQRVSQQAADSLAREIACRQFDVCVDVGDRRRVCLYEVYDDEEAFAEHLRSGHFLEFDQESKGWIETKVVERWLRVPRQGSAAGG